MHATLPHRTATGSCRACGDLRLILYSPGLPSDIPPAPQLAPVQLGLGPGSMVSKLLYDLGLKTLAQAAAAATAATSASGSSSTSGDAHDSTTHAHGRKPKGVGEAENGGSGNGRGGGVPPVQASLSRMRVHFSRSGRVHTERVDLRMQLGGQGQDGGQGRGAEAGQDTEGGPEEQRDKAGGPGGAGGGVHVAVWGSADLQADVVDFTLGVSAAQLLAAAGLPYSGLPEGYMLLVPLRGPASAPRYEVRQALGRLAQLGVRQKGLQWEEGRRQRAAAGEGQGLGLGGSIVAGLRGMVGDRVAGNVERFVAEDMAKTPPPPAAE